MLSVFQTHHRRTEQRMAGPLHRQHQRNHSAQVADDAGDLRADQMRDLVHKAFHCRVVCQITKLVGHRRRGHGWLFGGHRPVQHMNQHKAAGVIQARQKACPKGRHTQRAQRKLH